ncbi:uncharacterized protein SCHCODRAFT_02639183 [Schizophyllum commune H4-8]|uniref:uncharacterized protein n=1 Tax=Schizophyllum commune (strain H4-8 / FGSC 9210) TaxID=578458 RepID=UPI00215FFD37|nr:uncharacterized protein SCHCODRAFT_02639183 [Schizophyllum commune H4-8]KAI5887902.1 hypothetical protein SCHCODRAFT_02639183 [Schizophyllum commune H4-8]
MPVLTPGEPKEVPSKPQPIGNIPLIFLFTLAGLCICFLLWRRADALRKVVSHQLKTLTGRPDGQIRLSDDDGPTVEEFIVDDEDEEDNTELTTAQDLLEERARSMTPSPAKPPITTLPDGQHDGAEPRSSSEGVWSK